MQATLITAVKMERDLRACLPSPPLDSASFFILELEGSSVSWRLSSIRIAGSGPSRQQGRIDFQRLVLRSQRPDITLRPDCEIDEALERKG